ncbi:transcriptional antiterminator, BglG [Coriobacterium glomerans PW2]|uniref:Transcriptional antiterminator, BglG n=1 Tax=Coriobacterium glomerans (strain ATCC 49209 / DSM 20642 / JCM 10262 / PW2) TaxID=700015 RepID=F2NAZ5_CORGP|nr:BglG family transcription antiterminator [Coriobacterium glomerans]AEB07673.1 transcriptional antiterminator, BglG [Coriobacterium glomerans PW2]
MQDTAFAAYIASARGKTPAEIATHLQVSIRTVRTYVKRVNAAMNGFAKIRLIRGHGYKLEIECRDQFAAWMRDTRIMSSTELPQTPHGRVTYLLNDLLMRSGWITLEELAGILFVSRTAICNDMKEVERALECFGLRLRRRPHYGICVVGSEMARRLCLASIIMEAYGQTKQGSSFFLGADEAPAEGEPKLSMIASCVGEVLERYRFQINSVSYQNLLVHIAVALMRIKESCRVPMMPEDIAAIRGSREYPPACEIACNILTKIGVELPEEEIAYIAIHLAGKQTLSIEADDHGLVISDEVWGVVSEMLECVWKVFRFDFRNDIELRFNLARHIVPLAVRMRYKMRLKNPLLSDIQTRYPLAYSMATDASTILMDRYGSTLSADETGYIALAFALALERQKSAGSKKNILMVCASGAGSSRLLEYRCRQEFGAYIDKIISCDALNLSKVDFAEIDYVFTTVHIAETLPVPVLEMRYFLGSDEVEQVKKLLRTDRIDSDWVRRYFSRDLFFAHLSFDSKQEALDHLIDRVCERKTVEDRFRELVWKREMTAASAFGNSVAMPHPLEPASAETFVCVGVLDKPVPWDEFGHVVQVIFLSSFSADSGIELQGLYSRLADLLVSAHAITELVTDQRWETLENLLREQPDPPSFVDARGA